MVFVPRFKITATLRGAPEIHANSMGANTQLVWSPIGTRIWFMFHVIMPVPMQLHTVCVCGTMGSAWAAERPLKYIREAAPRRGGGSLPAAIGAVARFP
jgi:hypothetical protein